VRSLAVSPKTATRLCTLGILVGLCVKVALMSVAVWSYNFMFIVKAASIGFKLEGYGRAPWIILMNGIYRLWLLLPIDHPKLDVWLMALKSFPEGPAGYLLVALLKLPILVFDILCGVVLYKIFQVKGVTRQRALTFFTLWILNPYTTLFAEMDGTVDIAVLFFSLLTVYLYVKRRALLSSIPLLLGVTVKLYAILVLPVVGVCSLLQARRRVFTALLAAAVAGAALYTWWVSSTGVNVLLTFLNYTPLTFNISEILLTPYDSRVGLATAFGILYLLLIYFFWNRETLQAQAGEAFFAFLLCYFAFFNWWPSYLLLLVGFMLLWVGVTGKGKRFTVFLLIIAFLFELTMFDLNNDYGLLFLTKNSKWMVAVSEHLARLTVDVVVKLVVTPLLRSLYAVASLYYAAQILYRHSRLLQSWVDAKASG